MQARTLSIVQFLYKWSFLACLAVLPMSHTIALRNLLLVLLLALLLVFAVLQRHELPHLLRTARPVPWALLVWCAFLLLFPLWAVYPEEAWVNLRGQWGQSMLAWLIGFGAVWVLGRKGPGLWVLALASAFSVGLHVLMSMLAWLGLLGPDLPPYLPFGSVWPLLARNFDLGSLPIAVGQGLHVGFWGVEAMHGNLGYTACQTIALLSALLLFAWRGQERLKSLAAFLGISLCMVSILIASSRGAFLYAILVMLLAGLVYYYRLVRLPVSVVQGPRSRARLLLLAVFLLVSAGVAALTYDIISHDLRWQTMVDKVKIGLAQEDPARLLCEGLTPADQEKIRQAFKSRDPAYVDDLINGLEIQDGGRILLMRVGVGMVLQHPRGLDGSKSSYKKLIQEKCGHEPTLTFAHLHQSWMDIALALGWAGAGIFAWLLLSFMRMGWRGIRSAAAGPWAFALFLIGAFWFLRGFADSLYREHYLQMQAFVMAYLFGRVAIALREATRATGTSG